MGAFLLLSLVALLAVVATSSAVATDVTAGIASDTHWDTAGNPWDVKVNVVVSSGATLYIDPGAEVKFAGLYSIKCTGTGRIIAKGTATDPISVTSASAAPLIGDWDTVATGVNGVFENVSFEYGVVGLTAQTGARVSECTFTSGNTGLIAEGRNIKVWKCECFGMITAGMAAVEANTTSIMDCYLRTCAEGINLLNTTETTIVARCWVNNSAGHGFGYRASGGGNVIRECLVTRSQRGVLFTTLTPADTGGTLVYDCVFDSCSEVGVDFSSVDTAQVITVRRCQVLNGNIGFQSISSGTLEITECTFKENNIGSRVELTTGWSVYLHKNNFIKNNQESLSIGTNEVNYDRNGFGNFWWRYVYEYGKKDTNGDGIGDDPWVITGTQMDNYPLMKPVDYDDPVADAGPDTKVRQHRKFTLDGTRSFDETWIANYTWTVDLPGDDVVFYGGKPETVVDVAGVFRVTLLVTDPLGHTASDTMTLNVTDADAPVFVENLVPGNVSAGTTLNISAVISDNVDVEEAWVTYKYGLSGQGKRLDMVTAGDEVYYAELFIPLDLNVKIFYTMSAKDHENNIARFPESIVNVIDDTPPEVEPLVDMDITTGDKVWVNCTAMDNRQVSAVTLEYWFSGDDRMTANMSMQGHKWVVEVDIPKNASSEMFVVFNATDNAGNVARTEVIVLDVVDNDIPNKILDMSTTKFHKGEKADIKVLLWDNIGIKSAFVEVRYPPDADWEATPLVLVGEYYEGQVTVARSGVWLYYHFKVIDLSGNELITEDVERTMLSQRPVIVTTPAVEAWEGVLYEQEYLADDPDNEDYELFWTIETNATWLIMDNEGRLYGTPLDSQVGFYYVIVTVRDPDAVTDTVAFNVTVYDVNAAPSVTITFPQDEQKVGTVLKVSGRATDDLDVIVWVKYRVDEGQWEDATGTGTWSFEMPTKDLEPGLHWVDVKAFDGESESAHASVSFLVPEPEPDDDGPGFGWALAALAVLGAAALASVSSRRRND